MAELLRDSRNNVVPQYYDRVNDRYIPISLRNVSNVNVSDTSLILDNSGKPYPHQYLNNDGKWYVYRTETPPQGVSEYPNLISRVIVERIHTESGAGSPGSQGPQGPQGPKGDKGDIGPQGIQGPKGDAGPQGIKGDTGAVGPQGPQGIKGDKGDPGPQGPPGVGSGESVPGPKGDKGDPFVYSDFTQAQLNSLKGPKGDAGPVGPQGIKGDTGAQGPKGDTGATGPQGPKGDKGDVGPQGPKGDKGDPGSVGPQGPPGSDANISAHISDYLPHDSGLSQYSSSVDANGFYRVVEYKRPDTTLHLKSTASNPDSAGRYRTITWQFYAANGTTLALTKIWTITYDTNGVIVSKVLS